MSYLKINNLHVKLDKFALEVESLEIQKGSFFGILGSSGAGKSTLLNSICGLDKEARGNVLLDGVDISNLAPNKRGIAYVFQNSLLFEGLNVKENLEYILKAKRIKKENFSRIVDEALKDCEASELKIRDITTLSGGEKQRVALSMALMLKPKLLILDEPFSNLDSSLKARMREYLKAMVKRHDVTAVMVTHDTEDAFELFDEMLLLDCGEVIQVGSPKEMYQNPSNVKCAKYFGLENIFYGNIKDEYFKSKDFSLHVKHKDKKNICMIIPHNAIYEDKNGTCENVKESTFIDGRWKNKLSNKLVFYSNEKQEGTVFIQILNAKIIIKEEQF